MIEKNKRKKESCQCSINLSHQHETLQEDLRLTFQKDNLEMINSCANVVNKERTIPGSLKEQCKEIYYNCPCSIKQGIFNNGL